MVGEGNTELIDLVAESPQRTLWARAPRSWEEACGEADAECNRDKQDSASFTRHFWSSCVLNLGVDK